MHKLILNKKYIPPMAKVINLGTKEIIATSNYDIDPMDVEELEEHDDDIFNNNPLRGMWVNEL